MRTVCRFLKLMEDEFFLYSYLHDCANQGERGVQALRDLTLSMEILFSL